MKPIPFPDANTILSGEMPANRGYGVVLTKWRGCWRERIKFLIHGTLWLSVVGDTMPPTLITSDREFEITNPPRYISMERELTAAVRDERLYAEMVAILRGLASVDDDYCPFCGWDNYHIASCPVTRARNILLALDTPEERAARGCTSEAQ